MYEIWLTLNIVYEIARSIWPWLLALAVLWVILMASARGKSRNAWRATLPRAIAAGLAVGVVIFLVTPFWTRSGLGELKYWVDWANLIGIAVAWAGAAWAFAWPALTAWRARRTGSAL